MASGSLEIPLEIDRAGEEGIRAQLAAALRAAILSGTLAADESVPSSRVLAVQLRVSRGTVTDVYDQLVGEGFLIARARAATRVAPGIARTQIAEERQSRAPSERASRTNAPDRRPIDLRPGSPTTRSLVTAEWRAAWRAAVALEQPHTSPPSCGVPALRAGIASHLALSRAVAAEADDVVVVSGTADAVALVALACAERLGRRPLIAVEDPGYPSVRRRLHRLGADVRAVACDGDGLDLDELERLPQPPDLVVVTPSHQYPLGGRLPVERRIALLEWAAAHGASIVEDDYDSEFRHVGLPLPALASLDTRGVVAHVGSFSKIVTPWIRAAYLVLPRTAPLRPALELVLHDFSPTVSGIEQEALARYLDTGALRRQLARSRREYGRRRDVLLAMLGSTPWGSSCRLDGGLHTVLHLDAGADAAALVSALAARGVLVTDLAHYYASGRAPAPGIVLGYGNASDRELRRALERLIETLTAAAAAPVES